MPSRSIEDTGCDRTRIQIHTYYMHCPPPTIAKVGRNAPGQSFKEVLQFICHSTRGMGGVLLGLCRLPFVIGLAAVWTSRTRSLSVPDACVSRKSLKVRLHVE